MNRLLATAVAGIVLFLASIGTAQAAPLADGADHITPILLGSALPDGPIQKIDGSDSTLKQIVGDKPAVLIFFRGGWCPFCNLQLSQLRLIQTDLEQLGYQVIAITPERPAQLRKTLEKDALTYTLVSDPTAEIMSRFGIGYRVSDANVEKYRALGVDLENAPGANNHALPAPGVFITDRTGRIAFEYVHPDYRVRIPSAVVLAAAREIAADKHHLKPKE